MAGRSGKSGGFGEVRKPDPGSFQARFGELVRNARTRKGLNQSDVARLAFNDEEAKSRVSDVERGRNEPNADTINRFCEALGIRYEDVEALRRPNAVVPGVPEGPLFHLDIRAVPGFTGRDDLLESIDKALWEQGGTAAITQAAAVKGLGGVGKSVLAREYAWRARGKYRGVWWVRAETEQTLKDDLIDLGSHLIPGLKEVAERDRALHLALDVIAGTATSEKPWLIVYDNVEKPGAIRKLKPREHTHILTTSRWPDWQDEAQELPISGFAPDVAADYLLAKRPHETRDAADQLADKLGYLPLALSHARAYCAETNLSFHDYARRLSELIQEAPEDAEYPASVFATFSLAIAKAAEARPEAGKLMEIAAFLAPERIPLDIIAEEVMNQKQREMAVVALYKSSLLTHATFDDGSPAINVHRLVQAAMRERLGSRRASILLLSVRLAERAAADEFWRGKELNVPILPMPRSTHLLAAMSHQDAILGDDAGLFALTCRIEGIRAHAMGDHSRAEDSFKRAIELGEEDRGPDHLSIATHLEKLAECQTAKGRYEDARRSYARAIGIFEEKLGAEHPRTMSCRAANLRLPVIDTGVDSRRL